MGFWNKIFQRGRSRADPLPTGRQSVAGINTHGTLSPYRSITSDVLEKLRSHHEQSEAIDFLRKVNPDVSMAIWNFVRLSNMGHEMHIYHTEGSDQRNKDAENKWRDLASRMNEISNAGLDGLIDILHQMAYMRGGQALEVEVNRTRTDIIDVYPIMPQTIHWELEERTVDGVKRKIWIPYQYQMMKKVSLEKGKANFFWVPTDPDPDDPRGNLLLTPVLQAIDFQMQILQDLQAVLHRQGWPRNDISIDREAVAKHMPAEYKVNSKKQIEWYNYIFTQIENTFKNLEPDSDYMHFDDVTINMTQGANANRSLDVRAIAELVDIQTLSGSKQMSIFMNRNQGVTETWGSIQFMIFCNGIASIQRGSKRLIEEVARLWLRVHGIQGKPVFEHNKVDWKSEEQKATVKLMWQEFWAIAQLMGWCDGDKAASEVIDAKNAVGEPNPDRIRVSFSAGDGLNADQHKRKDSEGKANYDKVSYLRQTGEPN